MLFRLAMRLGKTVKQLSREIDSQELSEWIAWQRIEPLDDPYWRTALVCSTMANLWSTGKRKYKPEDFMPMVAPDKPKKKQTEAEMKALFLPVAN